MSVLEAMSVARPVIATAVGGVPDVVTHGETGLVISSERLTEMADALAVLASDRDRAAALGRAGRVRQRQDYSIEAMTAGYADLLTAVGR